MDVLRTLPSHDVEQLQVNRQGRQPLLAAHNMGRSHQVIVDDMGEMIGRDAVRLEQDDVLIVLGQLQRSLDQIGVLDLVFNAARRAETDDIALARRNPALNFLQRTVAVLGVLAVIAEVLLVLLLLRAHLRQLLLGAEARIRIAALDELLDKYMIDLRALALAVRTVIAVVAIQCCALVKRQTELLEGIQNQLDTALDFALLVGILNAEIEDAAGLMRQTLVDDRAEQVAQMHKSGRAGRHTGDLCSLRQLTRRIACLNLLRRLRDVREQQLCQTNCIHSFVHSILRAGLHKQMHTFFQKQ